MLRELRPKTKAAMVAEVRRDPAWSVLRSIPFLGPVRVSLLLATVRTPWRFRTKRKSVKLHWAGCGDAHQRGVHLRGWSARALAPRPHDRGLNRNHNPVLKDIFKGAATVATGRPGPLQGFYHALIARGMREELARVTLARKLAAVTLRLWKTGERYDPVKLTMQAR